jgi:hypothetical protein
MVVVLDGILIVAGCGWLWLAVWLLFYPGACGARPSIDASARRPPSLSCPHASRLRFFLVDGLKNLSK